MNGLFCAAFGKLVYCWDCKNTLPEGLGPPTPPNKPPADDLEPAERFACSVTVLVNMLP